MAQWLPIVQVDITLNTSGSTREGFGLPLFIATTDQFPDRVRTYTSITDVEVDFPQATSAVHKAAVKLWSQTPKVAQFSVARRDLQYLLSIENGVSVGATYAISLTGNDASITTISVNATTGDTAEQVFKKLKDAIAADPKFGTTGIAQVTASGSDDLARLQIVSSNPDEYFLKVSVQPTSPITVQSSPSDDAATFLRRIEEENSDWYFVALEERNEGSIVALSNEIGARRKLFFTATSLASALSGSDITSPTVTDWVARLAREKHPRTVVLWHQSAESDYPEMAYIAYGAPYDAGSISWGNAQLDGLSYSTQANGRPLTSNHKSALESRNCNYIDRDGGLNIARHGKVSKGEWVDIVRGADWLQSDLTGALRDLLVNQKGGKITYDDRGITRVRQVIESSLERAVSRNFLESYTVKVPRSADVAIQDKRDRILKDVSFAGILAGAIDDVNLQGTVAYE